MDEACYLWGRHVDSELREATRKAKTDKEAESKAFQVITRLLSDPEDSDSPVATPTRKFRDPAELLNRK